VTVKRVAIGQAPQPGWSVGLTAGWIYLPETAWLEGTVLIAEDRHGEVRRCDLATAWRIKTHTVAIVVARGWSFTLLKAWPQHGAVPASLVVEGPQRCLLTEGELLMLANIIAARPPEADWKSSRQARKAVEYLRVQARYQHDRNAPVDWSFRTDPQGVHPKLAYRPPPPPSPGD